jgi:hypothetical protein
MTDAPARMIDYAPTNSPLRAVTISGVELIRSDPTHV